MWVLRRKKTRPVFSMLKLVLKLFFPCRDVAGTENVKKVPPRFFICNHARSYGPIMMELHFPLEFRPWVIHNVLFCSKILLKEYFHSL
jgi:1-acyl-sn-glycerol-3-phosphate acyltransferase